MDFTLLLRASPHRMVSVAMLAGLTLPGVARAQAAAAPSATAPATDAPATTPATGAGSETTAPAETPGKSPLGDGRGAKASAETKPSPEAAGPFAGLGLSVGIGGVATVSSYQYSGVTGIFDASNGVVGGTQPAKEGRGLFLLGGTVQLGVHYPFSPRLAFLLDARVGYSAAVAAGDPLPFGTITGTINSSISGNVDYLLDPAGPWHLVGGLGWSFLAPQTDSGSTAYPLKNVMGPMLALGLDYTIKDSPFYVSGRLEGAYLRANGSSASYVDADGNPRTARFSGVQEAVPFSLFLALNARIFH